MGFSGIYYTLVVGWLLALLLEPKILLDVEKIVSAVPLSHHIFFCGPCKKKPKIVSAVTLKKKMW